MMARDHEQVAEINDNLDGASTPSLVFSSDDDDEEANQDLSLKIVEKAMRTREAKLSPNDDVSDEPSGPAAFEAMEESLNRSVIIAAEQEVEEIIKTTEKDESVEASAVQIGDNAVLRKLLRGPRYFDPPDSSWGACYNCGEEGHAAVNCTAAKRMKPCYVCGGLGHGAKQCTKAQSCFICKKGGHRAKDCPEKLMTARVSKSLTICLKCGNSGHDMFSCKNDYSRDDLKEIQCYLCKTFGHLCCVNTVDAIPGDISCYKCGQMGHTGLACSRLQSETTGAASPSLCYRCGEVGHFARECTSSTKAGKKNSEFSNTKKRRSYKENDFRGHWSAPHDAGKMHKKKRPLLDERGFTTPKKSKSRGGWSRELPTEERGLTTPTKSRSRGGWTMEHPAEERNFKRGFTTPKKSKSRGGWTMEHPADERDFNSPKKFKSRGGWTAEYAGEFSSSKSKRSSWRSPGTPSARSTKIHARSSGSQTPGWSYKSSQGWQGQQPGASNYQGLAMDFHHRYSASRFGNSSSDGYRRSHWR